MEPTILGRVRTVQICRSVVGIPSRFLALGGGDGGTSPHVDSEVASTVVATKTAAYINNITGYDGWGASKE